MGTCSIYGEDEKFILSFMWKPTGKRPLGRLRHRCDDNFKMDLQELLYAGMD
jgi:hypothetical protein